MAGGVRGGEEVYEGLEGSRGCAVVRGLELWRWRGQLLEHGFMCNVGKDVCQSGSANACSRAFQNNDIVRLMVTLLLAAQLAVVVNLQNS